MSEQNNAMHSLAHTKWNCKYYVVFAPKYRRKVFFNEKREDIWCKGYYVDTVGKNTKAIKEYITEQLKRDQEADQLSIYDPRDPFTGSK